MGTAWKAVKIILFVVGITYFFWLLALLWLLNIYYKNAAWYKSMQDVSIIALLAYPFVFLILLALLKTGKCDPNGP